MNQQEEIDSKFRYNPLETRPFQHKKVLTRFYCPLCNTKRSFTISPRLQLRHYFHISLTSAIIILSTYSIMGLRSLFWPLVVWALFECGARLLFKKEIPCPYCGFDASWYKKDVKTAKRLVQEFWDRRDKDRNIS